MVLPNVGAVPLYKKCSRIVLFHVGQDKKFICVVKIRKNNLLISWAVKDGKQMNS
jgi:hypothetical protein